MMGLPADLWMAILVPVNFAVLIVILCWFVWPDQMDYVFERLRRR